MDKPFAALLIAALLGAPALHAQAAAPAYDVVSVRPNKNADGGMSWGGTADSYKATNVNLAMLIRGAWNLKTQDMIYSLPHWADEARFDVEGKMDPETVEALKKLPPKEARIQRQLMLQALLADRFHLQVHHDVKQLPVYNLLVAKGGFKVKEADPSNAYPEVKIGMAKVSGKGSMMFGPGQFTGNGVTMASLSDNLSGTLGRMVVDKTNLPGNYDLALKWTPDEAQTAGTDPGPSLATALEEQLGLHLESTRGPVDTIVVEHVQQPTEN